MKISSQKAPTEKQFLAFYEFRDKVNPEALRQNLIEKDLQARLLGTLILSKEGINGAVTGTKNDTQFLLNTLNELNFNNLIINRYSTATEAFDRFIVKIKNEIVTSDFNVNKIKKSNYINPEKWDEEVTRQNMTIIDVRNFYESMIGSFRDAIKPKTRNFKEFKRAIVNKLRDHPKNKPIAMFCTGGIRCEKAADFLNSQGFSSIYKLNGGILSYFKNNKEHKSLWSGDCFVFDKRVAIDRNFERANYQQCYGCKQMIKLDSKSKLFDEWTLCSKCKKLSGANV